MRDSELYEVFSELKERLARVETRQEQNHDLLKDVRREISRLQWRVAGISAAVAGAVGGGLTLW